MPGHQCNNRAGFHNMLSGGERFRLWPDNPLDQSAKKGYSLEEIRIRLGRRQRNLSSQYLEEPFGVLDVADTMNIGVLHLRRTPCRQRRPGKT